MRLVPQVHVHLKHEAAQQVWPPSGDHQKRITINCQHTVCYESSCPSRPLPYRVDDGNKVWSEGAFSDRALRGEAFYLSGFHWKGTGFTQSQYECGLFAGAKHSGFLVSLLQCVQVGQHIHTGSFCCHSYWVSVFDYCWVQPDEPLTPRTCVQPFALLVCVCPSHPPPPSCYSAASVYFCPNSCAPLGHWTNRLTEQYLTTLWRIRHVRRRQRTCSLPGLGFDLSHRVGGHPRVTWFFFVMVYPQQYQLQSQNKKAQPVCRGKNLILQTHRNTFPLNYSTSPIYSHVFFPPLCGHREPCLSNREQDGSLAQTTVWTWAAMMFQMFCLGCWIELHTVFMVPLWVPPGRKGSLSTQVTDATCSSVNMRLAQIVYQSQDKCAQYPESSKNNKAGPLHRAAWLLSERHLRKNYPRLQMCQIPGVVLWCWGMCFIFSLSRSVFPSWANPDDATTHRAPVGKAVSQTGRRFKEKPVDSQSPFFSYILLLFLDEPYIILTRWHLLCPLDQLLLTHRGENRAALCPEQSNTLHSGGGNFVRRQALRD